MLSRMRTSTMRTVDLARAGVAARTARRSGGPRRRWFDPRVWSWTRQGLVATDRLVSRPRTRATLHQVVSVVIGAFMIGLGVAFFAHARLGLPPYDVLTSAMRDRTGLTLGQSAWALSGMFFLIAALLGQRPRLGGLLYVVACGAAVDATFSLLVDPTSLVMRVTFVVIGIVAIVAGIALVVHSGLTGGSFELLMRAGAERGLDPVKVRSSLEIGVVVAGVALGGDAGFATLAFAVSVGPVMSAAQQALLDHRAGRAARLADAGRVDAAAVDRSAGQAAG